MTASGSNYSMYWSLRARVTTSAARGAAAEWRAETDGPVPSQSLCYTTREHGKRTGLSAMAAIRSAEAAASQRTAEIPCTRFHSTCHDADGLDVLFKTFNKFMITSINLVTNRRVW